MAIQIGQYTRPGIYINEYDNSVISSPVVQGINTMVIGVSRKGPINSPVLLTNTTDLTNIFGDIDRGLERRGSFFHRTVTQMLSSSPVYALNLLATDDTLDTIEYVSLSTATDKSNGSILTNSYRKFFNTTGFWNLDTDSFIELTKNDPQYNDTLISLTNTSDKFITVFIFKTQVSGYDVTMSTWYQGDVSQIPSYVYSTDYVSDYMVDVMVVGGDWSNYHVLSVDQRWSKYFNASGLLAGQIYNFYNDRNVTPLAFYQGLSLIPYFQNKNGNNIFIESVINADTKSTGLFCSFNIDLFETDYPTGMVDLIGNNLVGTQMSSINFLSYNEVITEYKPYKNVILDRPGNVWGIDGGTTSFRESGIPTLNSTTRTGYYSEGYVYGVTASSNIDDTAGNINFNINILDGAYGVFGGLGVSFSATSSLLTTSNIGLMSNNSYSSVLVLHSNGTFGKLDSLNLTFPSTLSTDIVLGFATYSTNSSGSFSSISYTNVSVNSTGFNDLIFNTDYTVTDLSGGNIQVVFLNTAASPSTRNYTQYRKIKLFNYIVSLLSSVNIAQMSVIVNFITYEKASLANASISNIITSETQNKSFVLSTGLTNYSELVNGGLLFYSKDDEFILGENGLRTQTTIATASSTGVIGLYSNFYKDYYNGNINTSDYFYSNYVYPGNGGASPSSTGDTFNVQFTSYLGNSYITISTLSGSEPYGWPSTGFSEGDSLIFPDSLLNTGTFVLADSINHGTYSGFSGNGSDGGYTFLVSQLTTAETLLNVTNICNANQKHFLQMYIDYSNNAHVLFTDSVGASYPLTSNEVANNAYGIKIISDKSNYKETVEIKYPIGYTTSPNKVLVNAARYTNIKVGDYLQSYVGGTSSLQVGEVPKNLTRIISKKLYTSDSTLVELTCDARISTTNLGTSLNPDWQTTRFTPIENYISTYKAITLEGFRIREASMPDGTDTRQTEILNLVASGTPLFNALTNKEAIDFRYLVDSFGLGLIENSKQQLVDICGSRLDALGILNMPSVKQFKAAQSPSFVDANGNLDTSLIASGGDEQANPTFMYSFGQGAGTTCVGYFLPYLTIDDNGRPFNVPPAMFVATTYMRKHISNISSIVPWTIAAGVTNGKVTGFSNVEMDFTPQDISNLNLAQMNPIVFKRNRGFVVETENTSQTLYKSALSYLHVREVLIELERELSRMLLDFQWQFNTPEVRAEIKLKADTICEQYVNKNGLYNYFNKCDDENNTQQVIDSQIGVLDTYVEPIRGMGIIVNNITILRTGAIQSGGFITN